MEKIWLKNNIARRIENGHPWVYGNEINTEKTLIANIAPGNIVDIYNSGNQFVGRGYANPNSQIFARILTRNPKENIDENFFYTRILQAWEYRKKIGYIENCRLIFGEADAMPALIIDKFNDYFVLQTLAFGMEVWKPAIVAALNKIFSPKGIYERNDVPVRELEGLPLIKGFLSPNFNTKITINENGLKFFVDVENGQKTGYFLDQQDNRRAIKNIVKDADVLEAFCYTGTFSIHAGHYGAKTVLGLDISENAVAMATQNAALNNLQNVCNFQAINAFDALKNWSKEGKKYDVVMIDPPAFTKSRENIQKAIAGYKEINLRAMKMVKPGGFLVTASCTNLVQPKLFLEIIEMAAKDARKKLRQVTYQTQAADHPIVWGMENTEYLKFLIVEVN